MDHTGWGYWWWGRLGMYGNRGSVGNLGTFCSLSKNKRWGRCKSKSFFYSCSPDIQFQCRCDIKFLKFYFINFYCYLSSRYKELAGNHGICSKNIWKVDVTKTYYIETSATQSMVPRPAAAAAAPPGCLLQMQDLAFHPRPSKAELHLNKVPKWFVCTGI